MNLRLLLVAQYAPECPVTPSFDCVIAAWVTRCSTLSLMLLSSAMFAIAGCQIQDATETVPASAEPEANAVIETPAEPSPAPESPATPEPPDFYKQGLNRASSAFTIGQTARTPEDWQLVANRWQQAIDFMKSVPQGNPAYGTAQAKIAEYQRNWQVAIAKAEDVDVETIVNNQEKRAFRAKIIGRAGGTPVVLVAFNGNQTFPMIVDTGASKTLITQETAAAINFVPVGVARAQVADGRVLESPTGQVQSVNVAGAMAQNLQVSVAPPAVDLGLLGNNFFGHYNVTFEQDWVVFRER